MVKRGISIGGLLKKERRLAAASKKITDILSYERKEKNVVNADFLNHAHAQDILVNIMSLLTENVDKSSFRYLLFNASKVLLGFQQDFRRIRHLSGFSFDKATELLVKHTNRCIQSCTTVRGLSAKLDRSVDASLIWLNNYLALLDGFKGFQYLLEYGNIVPKRNGDLRAYEDLYNFGTNEQPLDDDLLAILENLDGKQDWRSKLVADGISLKVKRTFTLDELAKHIELFVNDIYSKESMSTYRDQLLDLISWCNVGRHAELKRKYLPNFDQKKDTIFYILTVKESPYNSQLIQLMKKPEEIPVLMAIAASGIPADKIKSLIDSLQTSGQVDKVVQYAQELKRRQDDFEFKSRLGKKMEDYFQEALEAMNINVEVKYIGSGSHDFVIRGLENQKEFYIELKSHAKSNQRDAISLAMTQARLAVCEPQRFALCVVERPSDPIHDIDRYMQEKVKYLGTLDQDFSPVVHSADTLDGIINDHSAINLELESSTYLVKVAREYIETHARSFQDLIHTIRQEIG